jgi:hypothetical protein
MTHKPATLTPSRHRLIVENDVLRGRVWFWRGISAILAVCLLASFCFGGDPLNKELLDSAGDCATIHRPAIYVSFYGVAAKDRSRYSDAISLVVHHISHAGVPIVPRRHHNGSLLVIEDAYFDPLGKAWPKARAKLTDPRWIADGETAEVVFSDNKVRTCRIVTTFNGGCEVLHNGKTFKVKNEFIKARNVLVVAPWLDIGSAKLLHDSGGVLVDAREFAEQAMYGLYNDFCATPPTLDAWFKQFDEEGLTGYGRPGVRGANLDTSGVTGSVRGLERRPLGIWSSFDHDKTKPINAKSDPFQNPERTHEVDAREEIAILSSGAMRTGIYDAKGNLAQFVPPTIAIDTSHGCRALRNGGSCFSCHYKGEARGIMPFVHSDGIPTSDDLQKAANAMVYYGDQAKLQRDAERDREDIAAGIAEVCSKMTPAEAIAVLNELIDQVTTVPVTPDRACVELGLPIKIDAKDTIHEWFTGVSNDVIGELALGQSVNYGRFRAAMPILLTHISNQRKFGK